MLCFYVTILVLKKIILYLLFNLIGYTCMSQYGGGSYHHKIEKKKNCTYKGLSQKLLILMMDPWKFVRKVQCLHIIFKFCPRYFFLNSNIQKPKVNKGEI